VLASECAFVGTADATWRSVKKSGIAVDDMVGLLFEIQECGRAPKNSRFEVEFPERAKGKPKQSAALLYIYQDSRKSAHKPVASYTCHLPCWACNQG
jgi:hypothetical protein